MSVEKIRKRDGRIVEFDQQKITEAIFKAAQSLDGKDFELSRKLAKEIITVLDQRFKPGEIPTVEQVQDLVEKILVEKGHYQTAKAYILYRQQHKEIREVTELFSNVDLVETYLKKTDWRVKENSNMTYSLQGLNFHVSSIVISQYWLNKIYPASLREAHKTGDFHIHDLGILGPYCVGWDLQDLLMTGFKGVRGKISSKPAKHFRSALGQIVNFFFTLQGEAAGAQALSNFDTLLAPFVRYDGLDEHKVKQAMQEFLYNINVPTRVGFQTPFTNITMDLKVPTFMHGQRVVVGGKLRDNVYGDFQKEVDMINRAFAEVMLEGDANGRVFTFPIPTYNITHDFDWENPNYDVIWEMTAKYGIPYFSNFVNSDMNPEDVRSMCCRLRLDNRELRKRGGGLFGANPLTGSIGVVTLNLPKLGYLAKNEDEFFDRLDKLTDMAQESLEIKRKVLEGFTDKGLYPYSRFYLRNIKKTSGQYWKNHFATIGIVGMNECIVNLLNHTIADPEGQDLALRTMDFIRKKLQKYQEETGNIYNLEATPAEGTSHRLAKIDIETYPDIIVANQHAMERGGAPYYTNSTQLPVNFTDDMFQALSLQDPLQTKYTGGTVFHAFVGESKPPKESVKAMVKKVCDNFSLPYFTITPTFSICPEHGYIFGEHFNCPKCRGEGKETSCEVYSRVVGYLRPVGQWNNGKREEFKERKTFVEAF
ncbi:ribonucleoside triphosphate reductase [archaeon]|nr:ribonucleoside triphosphate reductase [archaeon]